VVGDFAERAGQQPDGGPGAVHNALRADGVGIPIIAGQTCRVDLDSKAPQPGLVSRLFAERFFPGENPIGRQLLFGVAGRMEIVGVTGDVRNHGYDKEPKPVFYWCGLPGFYPDPEYLLKTAGDPVSIVNAVRQAVRAVEPSRAVYRVRTVAEALSESLAERRFPAALFTLFAGLAMLLAAVGIYGVISFFVSQRTREIGLRVALGARPRQILADVFRRSAMLTAAGLAVGLPAAALVSKFMASLLFGTSRLDPVTFAVAAAAISAVTGLATWGPAHRATRVDPLTALREE